MTTVTDTDDDIRAARTALAPDVVKSLREVAAAATELADLLEADPSHGIGLIYAKPFAAWDRADTAMRAYQNNPVEVLERRRRLEGKG